MKQYLNILKTIINSSDNEIVDTRSGETLKIFGHTEKFDLRLGFPIVTTKKMFWKGIVEELLWFLRGETNIKSLVDKNVNIWVNDAYRHYNTVLKNSTNEEPCYNAYIEDHDSIRRLTKDEFLQRIKNAKELNELKTEILIEKITSSDTDSEIDKKIYKLGDLGPVYGKQWVDWFGSINQLNELLINLKVNPFGRSHILTAWNPSEIQKMALAPCHTFAQFNCNTITLEERQKIASSDEYWKKTINFLKNNNLNISIQETTHEILNLIEIPFYYLDLQMYQRSADAFLGVPFNISSYALLLSIFARYLNFEPRYFIHTFGDLHLYKNHIDCGAIQEQLQREPLPLPKLKMDFDISEPFKYLEYKNFKLEDYQSFETIKAELKVEK